MCSVSRTEQDQLRLYVQAVDSQLEHRPRGRTAPLGRTARIQDPDPFVLLALRDMRVAVDDRLAAREPAGEPCLATGPRPGNVHEADPDTVHLDHLPLRERLAQGRLVHVPVHRLERAECAQLLEDGGRHDVAEVEDQVGRLAAPEALVGQPPRATREMRVGDDSYSNQVTPSRNAPSR